MLLTNVCSFRPFSIKKNKIIKKKYKIVQNKIFFDKCLLFDIKLSEKTDLYKKRFFNNFGQFKFFISPILKYKFIVFRTFFSSKSMNLSKKYKVIWNIEFFNKYLLFGIKLFLFLVWICSYLGLFTLKCLNLSNIKIKSALFDIKFSKKILCTLFLTNFFFIFLILKYKFILYWTILYQKKRTTFFKINDFLINFYFLV